MKIKLKHRWSKIGPISSTKRKTTSNFKSL